MIRRTHKLSAWTGWIEFSLQEVPSGDRRLQGAEVCASPAARDGGVRTYWIATTTVVWTCAGPLVAVYEPVTVNV